MRTSSKRNPAIPEHVRLTEPYVYPPVSEWRNPPTPGKSEAPSYRLPSLWKSPATATANPGVPEAEVQERERRAYRRGLEEGNAQARAEHEKALATIRQEVGAAVKAFRAERAAYFDDIETEVVRLALAIARKILHRESQIDPNLLAGIVRVALEKFEAGTTVKLRVHRTQLDAWRASFAEFAHGKPSPEVVADDSLAPEQCILETTLGSADLSLEAQLKEIEQGFFDLLAHRPGNLP